MIGGAIGSPDGGCRARHSAVLVNGKMDGAHGGAHYAPDGSIADAIPQVAGQAFAAALAAR